MRALFDQIRSALDDGASASAIGDVLAKVQAEIGRQRAARSEHDATAIDLLADHATALEADRALAETILNERRLAEAARQLDARRVARQEVEDEAARAAAYENAKAIRDRELAEIRTAWTVHARGLIDLVDRIAAADAEIAAACAKPPKGCDALGGLLDGIHSIGGSPNSWRPITEHLSVPQIAGWDAPGFLGKSVLRT